MPPKRKIVRDSDDESEFSPGPFVSEEPPARKYQEPPANAPLAKRPRGRPPRTSVPVPGPGMVESPAVGRQCSNLEVQVPKLPKKASDVLVSNEEDMNAQDEAHLIMARRYLLISLTLWSSVLMIQSLLVTTPYKLEIGSGPDMRPFPVNAMVLRKLSKFFETHKFDKPLRPIFSRSSVTARPAPLAQAEQSSAAVQRPQIEANTVVKSADTSLKEKIARGRAQNRANQATRTETPGLSIPRSGGDSLAVLPPQSRQGPEGDSLPILPPQPTPRSLLSFIDPVAFAIFQDWSVYSQIDQESIDRITRAITRTMSLTSPPPSLESLWFFGQKLGAPGFQNRIMQIIRTSNKMRGGNWPHSKDVRYIEEQRGVSEPCKLYDLAVICVAVNEPLTKFESATRAHQVWEKLLYDRSTIMKEALSKKKERFANVKPWHKNYLGEWLVAEKMMLDN